VKNTTLKANTYELNKINAVYLPIKTWKWWKVCISRQINKQWLYVQWRMKTEQCN